MKHKQRDRKKRQRSGGAVFNSDAILHRAEQAGAQRHSKRPDKGIDKIYNEVMTQLKIVEQPSRDDDDMADVKSKKRGRAQFFDEADDDDGDVAPKPRNSGKGDKSAKKRKILRTESDSDEDDIIDDLAPAARRRGKQKGKKAGMQEEDDGIIYVNKEFMKEMDERDAMPEDQMIAALEKKLGIDKKRKRDALRNGGALPDGSTPAASSGGKSELQKYVEQKRMQKKEQKRIEQLEKQKQPSTGKSSRQQPVESTDDDDADAMMEDEEEGIVDDIEQNDDLEDGGIDFEVRSDDASYTSEDMRNDGLDELMDFVENPGAHLDSDEDDLDLDGDISDDEDDGEEDGEEDFDAELSDDDEEGAVLDEEEAEEESDDEPAAAPASVPSSAPVSGKYVPPHLRKAQAAAATASSLADRSNDPQYQQLFKKLKSCINKLSESNLQGISKEALELYENNSKNDFHEIMSEAILDAICDGVNLMSQFVLNYASLIVALHNIGAMEIGAYFLEQLVQRFDDAHTQQDRQKCTNLLWMLCHLYNLKLVYSGMMYDLVKLLMSSMQSGKGQKQEISAQAVEFDIELLLKLLKVSGFQLREDDPAALKEVILSAQEGTSRVKASVSNKDAGQQMGARLTFMLDMLNDIKVNKQRQALKDELEKCSRVHAAIRKMQKSAGKVGDFTLRISYKDALLSKKKGRWWLVGSAWVGKQHKQEDAAEQNEGEEAEEEESHDEIRKVLKSIDKKELSRLEALAKEQRMNTDLRRTVFYILMGSEDYIDAFQNLVKLGLSKHDREIVRVLMHCCCQEKQFNPYYSLLAQKMCETDKNMSRTMQFVFYEHFKQLSEYPVRKAINLSFLLANLVLNEQIHLSMLKVVDFAGLSAMELVFFRLLFMRLLLTDGSKTETQRPQMLSDDPSDNDNEQGEIKCGTIFTRMVRNQRCEELKEALMLFLYQFVKKDFRRQFVYDLLSVLNVSQRNNKKWLKQEEDLLQRRSKKMQKVMRLVAIEAEEEMLNADSRDRDNDDRTLFVD